VNSEKLLMMDKGTVRNT